MRKNGHARSPRNILSVDIGGSKVKLLATGETEPRKFASGPKLTPGKMVEQPGNLAHGWVGFDCAAAFHCPVRMTNDAAMQALGSYDGGRMLFLGFGTGLGWR